MFHAFACLTAQPCNPVVDIQLAAIAQSRSIVVCFNAPPRIGSRSGCAGRVECAYGTVSVSSFSVLYCLSVLFLIWYLFAV